MKDQQEMSFVDHLEVLRWHLIRVVFSIVCFTIIGFFAMDYIFHYVLLAPMRPDFWTYQMMCKLGDQMCIKEITFQLQNRTMTGQFMMHLKSAFVFGFVCSFPYTVYEVWRFIKPGLYDDEAKGAQGAVFFVSFLFLLGILFGFYVITPLSFNFLINYKIDDSIPNIIDVTNYVSLFCGLILGSGLMFQLPVLIFVLSKIGIVTPSLMRHFRRHSIVVIFIVAAIITPSPDFFTQIVVAIPLILLYELSIFISAGVYKKKEQELIKPEREYEPY